MIGTVALFVLEQCEMHGQMHGYRWMHLGCLEMELFVDQETVRVLLHVIDPEGIELRRKRRKIYSIKGSNSVWHIDGYDKISRYGLKIQGLFDGITRQNNWLKASVSNKNPKINVHYYIESIKRYGDV